MCIYVFSANALEPYTLSINIQLLLTLVPWSQGPGHMVPDQAHGLKVPVPWAQGPGPMGPWALGPKGPRSRSHGPGPKGPQNL